MHLLRTQSACFYRVHTASWPACDLHISICADDLTVHIGALIGILGSGLQTWVWRTLTLDTLIHPIRTPQAIWTCIYGVIDTTLKPPLSLSPHSSLPSHFPFAFVLCVLTIPGLGHSPVIFEHSFANLFGASIFWVVFYGMSNRFIPLSHFLMNTFPDIMGVFVRRARHRRCDLKFSGYFSLYFVDFLTCGVDGGSMTTSWISFCYSLP